MRVLEFTSDNKNGRPSVSGLNTFKDYLRFISEDVPKQYIQMIDTELFVALQKNCFGSNNTDARDVFVEIKMAQVLETEKAELQQKLADVIDQIEKQIVDTQIAIQTLSQDKSFFGFGQIKPQSKAQMLIKEAAIEKLHAELLI